MGADYVALVFTWYMTNGTSSSIYSNTSRTHPDKEIIDAIRDIHNRGLKVMLKSHVDRMDGGFRGNIAPSDPAKWFASYEDFITNYAKIAEAEGVEMFCIGTELDSMSTVQAYSNNWVTIIQAIQNHYTGPLTYAANHGQQSNIVFWEHMDYGGVDAYFPLHPDPVPTIQQLIDAWEHCEVSGGDYGRNFVAELSNWYESMGQKPILFCEVGYSSREHAGETPWEWNTPDPYNGTVQSNCIEAFFRVWENKPWFKGAFIWYWDWDPTAGGVGDKNHIVWGKPAEEAVRIWYTGSYTPTHVWLSNMSVTPFYVTNDKATLVQFYADVTTDDVGGITEVKINLADIGGPSQGRMTNIGGDTYRYTYLMPVGLNPDEYKVYIVGYDSNGAFNSDNIPLVVITRPYPKTLMIYDGGDESADTDFNYPGGWKWGQPGFFDVTTSPMFGTYCGRFYMTNNICGIGHLRDNTWSGINASRAMRLEFWIRGETDLPADKGVTIRLFSTNSRYSAGKEIALTPNWRKVDLDVSFLTNVAKGADPTFNLGKFLGIQFSDAQLSDAGTVVYFDNIMLTMKLYITNHNADPGLISNTVNTNVDFTCTVISVDNITAVTLDLTPLGGGYTKVEMNNLGGGNYDYNQAIAPGLGEGVYALPVTAYDEDGITSTEVIYLSVAGPTVAIIANIYDGETPQTDANWEEWWGVTSFVDDGVENLNGNYSGRYENTTNGNSGGVQVPEPWWWQGIDVSGADAFECYFRAANGVTIEVRLFSYDFINGVQYANSLFLNGSGGGLGNWVKIATNMSFLTNSFFNPKKFVGMLISSDGNDQCFFDDVWFTANVIVYDTAVIPTLITNTKDNIVVFSAKAKTANLGITNVYIDLSTLGGGTNTKMTNIAGMTSFRYSFTVLSNQAMGNYCIPITAYDDKGYSGTSEACFSVTGREPFNVLIVYDGDIIKANPEQWVPLGPPDGPLVSFFNDVDGTTTPSHGGSFSGQYYTTNSGFTTLFHARDEYWDGLDVSSASKVSIWAKGATGGETLTIRFVFADTNKSAVLSDSVNMTLSPNWSEWLVDMTNLINTNIASYLDKFVGIEISGVPQNDVVYMDDIRFIKYIDILDEQANPYEVDGDVDTDVTFTCRAFSINGNITSVTLDLTPVGGGKVLMNNVSGWTSFQYVWTIFSNFGYGTNAGIKRCRVIAVDDLGFSDEAIISVRMLSKRLTILWDFETGDAQQWVPYGSGAANPSINTYFKNYVDNTTNYPTLWPDPYCPGWNYDDNHTALNLNRLFAFHGIQSIGWEYNISAKWYGSGSQPITPTDSRWNAVYHAITRERGGVCGTTVGSSGTDLSPYSGWVAFIYIEPQKVSGEENLFSSDPLKAQLRFTGGQWADTFFGPMINVIPGQWNKVWMKFDYIYDNVEDLYGDIYSLGGDPADPKEIGTILQGFYDTYGTNMLYYDYIIAMDDVAPGAPSGLTVSDPGWGGTLILNWDANGENDIDQYYVYQAKVNNPNQAIMVGATTTNYYEDKGVWNYTNYFYWVSAVDISQNEGPKSASASGYATGVMPTVVYPYKGVTVLSSSAGELQQDAFHIQLTNMTAAGVNTVGLIVTWFMSTSNSVDFISNAQTLPDADIIHAIQDIHNMGMKVFLKPKIEVLDGADSAHIKPSDKAQWFNNYRTKIIQKYAALAANNGVELFSIGEELNSMATNFSSDWDNIISDVRTGAGYTNDITYSAV